MPCSPWRRIRLVTIAGELAARRARLGQTRLRRLDTSNGCQDHTVLPSVVVHFSHPLTLPDNFLLPTKNARSTVIFRCRTRNTIALRGPQWHPRYTAGPLLRKLLAMAERLTESLRQGPQAAPARGALHLGHGAYRLRHQGVCADQGASQGRRTFVLSYWINGSERRLRIGSWPDWSVMAARAEAKEIRQRVDRGEDPAGDRRERREAPTMLELAERYKREHLPRKAPTIAARRRRDARAHPAPHRCRRQSRGRSPRRHRRTASGHHRQRPSGARQPHRVLCVADVLALAQADGRRGQAVARPGAGQPVQGHRAEPGDGEGAVPEPGRDRGGGRGSRRLWPHVGGRLHSPDHADRLPTWRGDARHLGAVRCPARVLDQADHLTPNSARSTGCR